MSCRCGRTSRHAVCSFTRRSAGWTISTRPVKGATQYLVSVIFASGEGHHAHDAHPGFEAWNAIADTYQVGRAMAFGGETVVELAEAAR